MPNGEHLLILRAISTPGVRASGVPLHAVKIQVAIPDADACRDGAVFLIGDFASRNDLAARRLKYALSQANMCVYAARENAVTAASIEQSLMLYRIHVLLYVRTHGLTYVKEGLRNIWDVCEKHHVISVAWMSDLHAGLQTDESDHMWAADVVVSADASEEASIKVASIFGAKYMHVGEGAVDSVHESAVGMGTYTHHVVVVGGRHTSHLYST